jgi:hypothetical protein|tara:strand:+ start:9099 stop:9620 length:522 start_codon:yes stop_codon:yes gene_type:complete
MASTAGSLKGNNLGVYIDRRVTLTEEQGMENWDTFEPFYNHPAGGGSINAFTWIPVAYSSNATISINTEVRKYIQPVIKADRTENKRTGVTSATISVDGLVALDHSNFDLEELVDHLINKEKLIVAWSTDNYDDYAMFGFAYLLSLEANAPVNGFVEYSASFEISGKLLEFYP